MTDDDSVRLLAEKLDELKLQLGAVTWELGALSHSIQHATAERREARESAAEGGGVA